jgi:hypothetical protein
MSRPIIEILDFATGEKVIREMNDQEYSDWQSEQTIRDEQQSKFVRAERDSKLAECDWRVIKAIENNQPQDFEWAAYRQALRDVPTQAGFPLAVIWPQEPGA